MEEDQIDYSRRDVLKKGAIAAGSLVLGGTATGTAAAGIGDGRVLDYHLNNVNYNKRKGTTDAGHVHDASTYKNDGKNYGAEVVKDGAVGNAFAFDGGEYITVPDDASLQFDGSFTAAGWVKFAASSSPPNDYEFFLAKRGVNEEYQVYYSKDQRSLKYYNGEKIYPLDLDLVADTWHHLAWVFDGSKFIGYHNGKEVGRTAAAAPQIGKSDLYLGKDNVGNYIKAKNDEVRLYNRALSDTEIQELASMGDD